MNRPPKIDLSRLQKWQEELKTDKNWHLLKTLPGFEEAAVAWSWLAEEMAGQLSPENLKDLCTVYIKQWIANPGIDPWSIVSGIKNKFLASKVKENGIVVYRIHDRINDKYWGSARWGKYGKVYQNVGHVTKALSSLRKKNQFKGVHVVVCKLKPILTVDAELDDWSFYRKEHAND